LGGQGSLGGSTSSAGSRAQLTGLVAADGSASAEGPEDEKAGAKKEVVTIFASTEEEEAFTKELDMARQEIVEQAHVEATVIGSSTVVTTGLSVGYVLWMARGGLLLASLLSTMPAWRVIDPLPVLAGFRNDEDQDDDESLESLVKKGAKKKPAVAPEAAGEDPGTEK
jgi:hypothetical protein